MAAIAQAGRHGELTPKCQVTLMETANSSGYSDVRLTGGGLERLDEVTVTILDDTDQDHRAHRLPDGVTQEQASAFVWGPWQFDTGASDQVLSKQDIEAMAVLRGVSGKNWIYTAVTDEARISDDANR